MLGETKNLERTLKRVDKQLTKTVKFIDRNPYGMKPEKVRKLVAMIDECYLILHPEAEAKQEEPTP